MQGSFIDENGVERYAPQSSRAYEDRPAPWIRLVLGVLCIVFVWAGVQARDRAGGPPEESVAKVWLDYPDTWSKRFENRVVPAYDSLVGGAEAASRDTVLRLFLGGSPFPDVPELLQGMDPPADLDLVDTAEEQVRFNYSAWSMWSSPHERPTQELGMSWDLAVLELVGNDPATIDLEGLAALDPREFLTRLRAQEAVAREAMQRDYDELVRRGRWYTVAKWAFFVLAVGCIAAALWVRRATLKAVRRDNERLRHEWRVYSEARSAAAARAVADTSPKASVGDL